MEVIRQGDSASCGQTCSTGSPNVFVNGRGVIRCNIDTAQGLIIPGPANKQTVFVNGYPIAVKGDLVATHGANQHLAATLTGGSLDVFAY